MIDYHVLLFRLQQYMKPFQGITFCPTGLNDEYCSRSIAKKIVKLGGLFFKDLTRQVSVLVIGKTRDTNKYKFAVRHRPDMTFVSLEAVETIYERWLAGEDLSAAPELLRSRYSLPPLSDTYVFIGRVDPQICPVDRLEKLCRLQGCYDCNSAQFARNCISRNQGRLVVFISDTLHGSRVKAAAEVGVPIIHPKWILDCHKRNATLEYDPYYMLEKIEPRTPLERIGTDSCECWKSLADPPTVLRDSKSPTEPKMSLKSKFKPQGEKLWQKAMSVGPTKETPLIPDSSKTAANPAVEQLSSFQRIFEDISFEIDPMFAEPHAHILQKVIEQHAGAVQKPAKYHLIPSNTPIKGLSSVNEKQILVTEFFVERCLHYKKLIDPPDSWCTPFLHDKDVQLRPATCLLHDRSNVLSVAITGFRGVELLHLTKLLQTIEPMGLKFTEFLSKSTDLLLINLSSLPSIPASHPLWKNKYGDLFQLQAETEGNGTSNQIFRNSMKRKIEFVKQRHSIPVVTPAFLMDLLSQPSKSVRRKSIVYLNNINWCIICPRGTKENFAIEVVSKRTAHAAPFSNGAPLTSSVKESRFEVLDKVNQVRIENTKSCFKLQSASSKRELSENEEDKGISAKRTHIAAEERSSSWGNLMSEEVNNVTSADFGQVDHTPESDNLRYTQVTYGTSAQETRQGKVRKLTRKHMRELGS
ncbi:DPB11 (YJL090C) [Zygosaccharomyces parabailii]|nr:DPB11 (YJL090C) [Zygosaccharomyces parabailii]